MFRTAAAVAALCFVAAYAAPFEVDEETKQLFTSLKSLDKSFLAEVKELFKNGGTQTRAQLLAALDAKIAALPADQQEVANKVKTFFLSKEDAVKAKLQEKIATLSAGAQEVANKVLALTSDTSLTGNQLAEQVKAIFAAAPQEVQDELKAAKTEFETKIKAVAEKFKGAQ